MREREIKSDDPFVQFLKGRNSNPFVQFLKDRNSKKIDSKEIERYFYDLPDEEARLRLNSIVVYNTDYKIPLLVHMMPYINSHMVEIFINKGRVNIHQPDSRGDTALYRAVFHNNLDAVKCLLKYGGGADINRKNLPGLSPIDKGVLSIQHYPGMAKLLLSHPNANILQINADRRDIFNDNNGPLFSKIQITTAHQYYHDARKVSREGGDKIYNLLNSSEAAHNVQEQIVDARETSGTGTMNEKCIIIPPHIANTVAELTDTQTKRMLEGVNRDMAKEFLIQYSKARRPSDTFLESASSSKKVERYTG